MAPVPVDVANKLLGRERQLQQTFDIRWKADMRAVDRWREANPGNELVLPDRADLVFWMLENYVPKTELPLEGC
jgi:hypothetical protein